MSREACAQGMRKLVEWAAATPVSALPRETLIRAVRVVADDLAAITGARDEPEVKQFHDRVLARGGREEATVFRGGRGRVERVSAAAGAAAPVSFELPVAEALGFVNEDGATVLYPGTHFLDVSDGGGVNNVTIAVVLEGPADVVAKRPPRPAGML